MGIWFISYQHLRHKAIMENYLPKEVKDSSDFRHAWNMLMRYCKRTKLYNSSDILVSETGAGTTLTLVKKPSGSSNNLPGTIDVVICDNGIDRPAKVYGYFVSGSS